MKFDFQKMPPINTQEIETQLRELNVPLTVIPAESISKSVYEFQKILQGDREWMTYYKEIYADKWLEHFLSIHFLEPHKGETLIDVASHWSPFNNIVKKIEGVRVYRHDQVFDAGVHGNDIGSDVISIPMPDRSVDMLAVNNSIEHFEQEKDIAFLREAYRLLKPGGRLCIVPLFMNSVSVNMVDPEVDVTGLVLDPNAVVLNGSPWKFRFARFYTPKMYVERLMKSIPEFKHHIFSIRGMTAFDPKLNYWQFVSVVRKS